MNFFHKESKFKIIRGGGGGGGGGGEGGFGRLRGAGGDGGRWMNRLTSPNQFASSTSSKLGA